MKKWPSLKDLRKKLETSEAYCEQLKVEGLSEVQKQKEIIQQKDVEMQTFKNQAFNEVEKMKNQIAEEQAHKGTLQKPISRRPTQGSRPAFPFQSGKWTIGPLFEGFLKQKLIDEKKSLEDRLVAMQKAADEEVIKLNNQIGKLTQKPMSAYDMLENRPLPKI